MQLCHIRYQGRSDTMKILPFKNLSSVQKFALFWGRVCVTKGIFSELIICFWVLDRQKQRYK